ncbi:MAG TPA: metallophosphoesterase family protein [Candidatus Saccharimonadales bacterium]|nr:metallophosphoesterase family protein [Candidatus Saccharimonadales bacterium]
MRVALLSDIHANLVALEAVLAEVGTAEEIWVMGDTVGYGPDPGDVLAALADHSARLVAGNHDRAVATGAGLELFNPAARAAAMLHREWLSGEERDALAALPLILTAGSEYTVCHGSPRDPLWEYVFDQRTAVAAMRSATTTHCCNGHTHVPAVIQLPGGGRMINPGSVGQPRDGDPRAAYAWLDTTTTAVELRRVAYDITTTQERIRRRGLPEVLADRLTHGF